MTIDEAIASERNQHEFSDYNNYHEQIAEWLEELKAIKSDGFTDDLLNMGFTKGYNKAIDDFIHECDKYCEFYSGDNKNLTREAILSIAEQLKEGVVNGT